jgi:hypothetical protein
MRSIPAKGDVLVCTFFKTKRGSACVVVVGVAQRYVTEEGRRVPNGWVASVATPRCEHCERLYGHEDFVTLGMEWFE